MTASSHQLFLIQYLLLNDLLLHLILCPFIYRFQRRNQCLPSFCKGVLHCGRDRAVLRPGDQAVRLQFPQALGQHGGCDAHHLPFQSPVAQRLTVRIRDIPENRQLPFLPDDLHGIKDRALGFIDVFLSGQGFLPHMILHSCQAF